MGSQTLDILRQGIWASLTGGWYYDPYQNIFCNTFHLYLWLLLFCLPLIIYFYITIHGIYFVWIAYVLLITLLIGIIKYMNLKLHKLFDTTECITEESDPTGSRSLVNAEPGAVVSNANVQEAIELKDMKSVGECNDEDEEEDEDESFKGVNPESKTIVTSNYKVDVHRKNSTSNSSNSEFLDLNYSKSSSSIPKIGNEVKLDAISPGTSEEFCVKNKLTGVVSTGNVGVAGGSSIDNVKNGTSCANADSRIRKNEQRSNSIDVFFSNHLHEQSKECMKAVPSTSTSSAFELSSKLNRQYEQPDKEGLVFWNMKNQWDGKDQSGSIESSCKTESGKRNPDKTNLELEFSFGGAGAVGKTCNPKNESVYSIVEKNESYGLDDERDDTNVYGDGKDSCCDDEDDDDDDGESRSPLIRKKGITSISMCSVDKYSEKSMKLNKQDSINSKYSYDSIDKPCPSSYNNKCDKQSISFDISSFDSADSTLLMHTKKLKQKSPNPSMYCHSSIQNSQKESSNQSMSSKSSIGSMTSVNLSTGKKTSFDDNDDSNQIDDDGSHVVEYVNEKPKRALGSSSGGTSRSSEELDLKKRGDRTVDGRDRKSRESFESKTKNTNCPDRQNDRLSQELESPKSATTNDEPNATDRIGKSLEEDLYSKNKRKSIEFWHDRKSQDAEDLETTKTLVRESSRDTKDDKSSTRKKLSEAGRARSENASQEDVKNLDANNKLAVSTDYQLDWLFEHTDSENEKVKEKVKNEVQEENSNYLNKKDEIVKKDDAGDGKTKCGKRKDGRIRDGDDDDDDDDEEDRNDREILVLNVKKKKRNRRDRRQYFGRRSLHVQSSSNVAGPSSLGMMKKDLNYSGGAFNLHDSLYKNSQQSEDDYDDDADDDVYIRTKSNNSTTENSSANQISHKEMLQIFLANKATKWNNEDEVFSFKNDDEGAAGGGSSVTSGLGSCMSTSPVPTVQDEPNLALLQTVSKMERYRTGRHSRSNRRHHGRVKHFNSRTHRRNPLVRQSLQPSSQVNTSSYQIQVPSGTHLASSYNDTTEGAVHIFRDENGELMSYMFDEKGLGLAQNIRTDDRHKALKVLIDQQLTQNSTSQALQSTDQSATVVVNEPSTNSSASTSGENVSSRLLPAVPANSAAANVPITQLTQNINGSFLIESFLPLSRGTMSLRMSPNTMRVIFGDNSPTRLLENEHNVNEHLEDVMRNRFHFMDSLIETPREHQQESKRYYQFSVFPFTNVKVHFNRLMLLSLLDHNFTLFYTFLCLFLTIFVAIFGSWLLYLNFYKDINVFIFCFVIAGCQYSMLKSVQPDASSPTHGFNKIIVFSRPVYFILVSSLILILHYSGVFKQEWSTFTVYNIHWNPKEIVSTSKELLISFLLYFPLIFSFGLFPQVNTFLMYFLEQIDIYIFGGNATCSVISSVYCIFRSLVSVLFLYGFAYAGLSEPKSSQHILFSIYCGLVVATSYHLSRSSSDPLPIWNIVKKYLCPIDEEELQERVREEKKVKNEAKKVHRKERKTSSISRHDEHLKEDKPNESVFPMDNELQDPLPMKLINTVNARLKSDLIICTLVCIFVFGIHCSTVFSALQPLLNHILWGITISLGILLHYIFPHLRKQLPWLCISRPVLKSNEYSQFEVRLPAKIMWFEKLYVYLCFLERNIVYPVLFIATITHDAPKLVQKFGPVGGSFLLTTCALKCLRSSFSDPSAQYLVLSFSILFQYDFSSQISETFLLDYCITSIVFCKCYEFFLKIQFVVTYIAPWQITWGSAFHAFAQPFSVPHSAMMFLQAFVSAILSSPLYPFLGSAIFLTSYPRPVKFWERDYNTRRADHSNTRLITQFDRTFGSDDNNLNSIFYEHLTRSLQHSLCGDLLLGRWGSVSQGDCFVLASDYLNCLIHIIEIGNGLVTFQMRGLEFRGTYCQQREVEAISESVEDNEGCCCCEPGHIPNLLSLNAAFSQRWLAWEVTTTKYVLEGYSISDNSAASMLQVFEFRKVLISYYVRSIIYYASNASKLEEWLTAPVIVAALQPTLDRGFVDLDPVFNMNIDEDYDFRSSGITRSSFCSNYLDWIQYCAGRRKSSAIEKTKDSNFVSLCFALSLLGRRTLGAASHNTLSSVEFFLYGLHALFKGDFRITCERDEWIFSDMDLLKKVVAPAVKMSLKLHQDHFTSPDDYEDTATLYNAITQHHEKLVISHEGDPTWRNAVLSGTQSLLALRHVLDDGVDEYKVIMLNKRYLSFRIVKMNRECVRGLWAGQQQELVYLRNRNPERGSIQNAKQALRNIINSSCDQPIGYPIFVSPLTTSYAETNEQLSSIVGGSLSLGVVKRAVMRFWRRIQRRCIEGCSSGGTVSHEDGGGFGHDGVFAMTTFNIHAGYPGTHSIESNITMSGGGGGGGSISRGNRSSLASIGKPSTSTLASLAGLLSSGPTSESSNVKLTNPSTATLASSACDANSVNDPPLTKDKPEPPPSAALHYERVRIVDPYQVHDALNLGRRIDVMWPDEKMRQRGGRTFWKDWLPEIGMEGQVVHKWIPNHRDPNKRSNVDRTILLIKIDDKYVPISESGVQNLESNEGEKG